MSSAPVVPSVDPSAAALIRASRLGFSPPIARRAPTTDDAWPWTESADEAPLVARALRDAAVGPKGRLTAITGFVARSPVRLASFEDGTSLLLKWLNPDTPGFTSDNELFVLRLLDELALPPVLRSAVPRLVAVDTRQRLVVLEGAEGLHTLRAVGRGAPSPAHVVHLAAALSALHSLDVETVRADHPDRRLHLPIESMMDLTPAELALGPGSEYASYAKAVQAVDNEIRALIAGWRPNRLIHFDIRDANVLLAGGGQDRADPVRLVDWELAGWGDPLYDVGSLVGQLVYHSLRGTMLDAEHGLGQPAAMTFVGAYLRLARIERPDPLEAIVSYAGVFLLLRALATLQVTGSLGPVAKLALLLGGRFLSHPDTSADLLLPGLREPVA